MSWVPARCWAMRGADLIQVGADGAVQAQQLLELGNQPAAPAWPRTRPVRSISAISPLGARDLLLQLVNAPVRVAAGAGGEIVGEVDKALQTTLRSNRTAGFDGGQDRMRIAPGGGQAIVLQAGRVGVHGIPMSAAQVRPLIQILLRVVLKLRVRIVCQVDQSGGGQDMFSRVAQSSVFRHLALFRIDEADAGQRSGDGKPSRRKDPQDGAIAVQPVDRLQGIEQLRHEAPDHRHSASMRRPFGRYQRRVPAVASFGLADGRTTPRPESRRQAPSSATTPFGKPGICSWFVQ